MYSYQIRKSQIDNLCSGINYTSGPDQLLAKSRQNGGALAASWLSHTSSSERYADPTNIIHIQTNADMSKNITIIITKALIYVLSQI